MPDQLNITEIDLGPDAPAFIGSWGGEVVLNTNPGSASARVRWELRNFAFGVKHMVEEQGEPLDMREVS